MTEAQREIRRKRRVLEYAEKHGNINTTCRRFGIARSTFYLWRDRYRELGEAGLARRRRCSHNRPNKTPDEGVEEILHLRYRDDVDLKKKLAAWEKFYNYDRPHGAHKGKTPYEALREKLS